MQIALMLQFACNGEHIAQFAYPYILWYARHAGFIGSRRRRCRAEYRGARRYVGKDLTIAAAEPSFSTFLERTIEGFTPNSGHPALSQPYYVQIWLGWG